MTSAEKIRSADLPALKLIHYPDPRLREVSTPIDAVDDAVRALAQRMAAILSRASGVGLAGCQVGVTVRLFLAGVPDETGEGVMAYINPRIVEQSDPADDEEGCLSFPSIYTRIKRYNTVVLEAIDLEGRRFQQTAQGLMARCFQHECDHIDGRMIIDRMGSVARLAHRKALKQLEEDFAEL
ncbi:MAG: peptide deformylase [Planctomycetaceae bacterium]|nr:peptide deformylase [Planctomycetaceae bacterium]